jgi:hypothetical protein
LSDRLGKRVGPAGYNAAARISLIALVDDSRVYHGVTAVTANDPRLPAYRDVLVVTLRRE